MAFDYCPLYPPIESCFRKACGNTASGILGRPSSRKHLRALHSVFESCRLFSVASRVTSDATPTLLFLPKLPPEDHEALGQQPDFIAGLDGQQDEPVFGFIAFLAMSLPKKLRPSAWWRPTPFRDCGGYSSPSEEGRVSWPGRRGTRATLRRVGFSAQEVDGCSVTVAQWLSADGGAASAFQRMLDAFWTVRHPWLRRGVDVKQPLSTAFTMRM